MSNPTQQVPSTIPAGWYPNPQGEQQWWDGYQWGILKPKPNGYGTIAIITGAISLVICLIPFGVILGGIGALTAIVFGIIGIMRARKGSSIAGITFGVIALILGIIITSATITAISQNAANPPTVIAPVPAPDPTTTVVYSVTGVGGGASDITYDTFAAGNSGSEQATNQALPFTKTVEVKKSLFGGVYSLTAQGDTGTTSISCTITVDGKIVSTHTSTGEFAVVSCSG